MSSSLTLDSTIRAVKLARVKKLGIDRKIDILTSLDPLSRMLYPLRPGRFEEPSENTNIVFVSFDSIVKVSNKVVQICPYIGTMSLHKDRSTIDT